MYNMTLTVYTNIINRWAKTYYFVTIKVKYLAIENVAIRSVLFNVLCKLINPWTLTVAMRVHV